MNKNLTKKVRSRTMADRQFKTSEAQLRAQKKYDKAHKKDYRNFFLKCNKVSDADIIEYLEGVDNYAGLLKKLVREQIKSGK